MKRRTFDKIVTIMGAGLTVFLFIVAGLLNFGYNFADKNLQINKGLDLVEAFALSLTES